MACASAAARSAPKRRSRLGAQPLRVLRASCLPVHVAPPRRWIRRDDTVRHGQRGLRWTTSVDADALLARLAAIPDRIARAVAGWSEAELRAAPTAGEWSAVDILAHLRASADIMTPRIYMVLVRDRPPLPAYDERRWAQIAGLRRPRVRPVAGAVHPASRRGRGDAAPGEAARTGRDPACTRSRGRCH